MAANSDDLNEVLDQLTNFTYSVTMTTSYSGDWYPYEWLVDRCQKKSEVEARAYCSAVLEVLRTSDKPAIRDNCIRFLQESLKVDFVDELIALVIANADTLRAPVEIQGTLGATQLAACYHALLRNSHAGKIGTQLPIEHLRELVMAGELEFIHALVARDREWVRSKVDGLLQDYPDRVAASSFFDIMHRELGVDPLEVAMKLIPIFKDKEYRLKELWTCLESFAERCERKELFPHFVEFVRDIERRTNASA